MSGASGQAMDAAIARCTGLIARAEDALLAGMMLLLVGLSSLQIGRRVLFNDGWIDSDAVTRNLVLWIAVLGALAATRERRHVSIDLFGGMPPSRWRAWMHRLAELAAAIGCAALAWFGFGLLQLEWEGGTELLPHVPTWTAVVVIPLGQMYWPGLALPGKRYRISLIPRLIPPWPCWKSNTSPAASAASRRSRM